ncbi:MAG: zinc metallopeptidase [Chloroflexota bacterium]|nr:zinc metallopeptidase [Chloroflexota bacterium]
MYFDPLYFVFALPALILVFFAQWKVKSTYTKYAKVANMARATGAEVAQKLLAQNNLGFVNVQLTPGELSDHYNPGDKTLNLSAGVANRASVAAMGIVAHEVGHAVQDATAFGLMRLRTVLVPVANLGSNLGYILFFLGLVLQVTDLAYLGIILFGAAVLFTLVTLPVELDASRRAMIMLRASGMVSTTELDGARSMLTAAALTYVAALAQALAQLLYMVFRAGSRRDD